MSQPIQVTTTTPSNQDAERIAQRLVERRLAACVQVVGPIASTYWWQGKVERSEEWLCIAKSRADLFAELEQAVREMHPYEVPEVIAVPIVEGSKPYLDWLARELEPTGEQQ